MRNAVIFTLLGILLVSLVTIGAAYALPPEIAAPVPSISAPIDPSAAQQYPYLLRTYDGKLAVFTDDLVEPDMIFDVYVRTLPQPDQTDLERGVRIESYEKLTALIEDYIS